MMEILLIRCLNKRLRSKNIIDVDYDENNEILNDEAAKFLEQGINDKELIQEKIKKTYKNRYFILTNKTNKQDQDQELVKIELLN